MKTADKSALLDIVLKESGATLSDFRSTSRLRNLCFARMAYTKIRREMGARVEDIGNEINRDHSTVSHITAVHDSDYRYCPKYHNFFERVKKRLIIA
jgi:chromosomal replication initiation ATPase DnaA